MPELPDVTVYVERLTALLRGQPLERIRLVSPFLVRTVDPPLAAAEGRRLLRVHGMGNRTRDIASTGAMFSVTIWEAL